MEWEGSGYGGGGEIILGYVVVKERVTRVVNGIFRVVRERSVYSNIC